MKSKERSDDNDTGSPAVDEQVFADYLEEHPDFFQRHPSLLSQLIIPHPDSGRAISLLERQVIALRDDQRSGQRKLRELISNARENDRLGRRMEELTLYLLTPQTLDERFEELPRRLQKIFDLEYAALKRADAPGAETLGDAIRAAQCTVRLPEPARRWLFDDDAPAVASCAIMPLTVGRAGATHAVLAFGSAERARYHPDAGTHYVKQLQRLISASLGQLHALERN